MSRFELARDGVHWRAFSGCLGCIRVEGADEESCVGMFSWDVFEKIDP